jgi:hypothetical protein
VGGRANFYAGRIAYSECDYISVFTEFIVRFINFLFIFIFLFFFIFIFYFLFYLVYLVIYLVFSFLCAVGSLWTRWPPVSRKATAVE